jgi:hypothetical protein
MIGRKCIVVALMCLAAPAAADIQWGANGHPITAYPGIPIADQLDLLRDLGMTSYRVNISFAEQADHLGRIIVAAQERGIDILPVLTPGGLETAETKEEIYDRTYAFANALGQRFGDDIPVWELGNEQEVYAILQPCEMRDDGTQYPCEWGHAGGVDPLDYHGERWAEASALLRGLSDGLRDAVPTAVTAMGTAGWGHVGAFERMRRDGLNWDISVWHLYGEDPEWAFEILKGYHRPIWITEMNHPYGSQNGAEAQAEGLATMMRRLQDLSERYRVEAVHIYQILDEPYWEPSFEAVMGLVTLLPAPDSWMVGPPKPAYRAVRDVIRRSPPRRCEDVAAIRLPGMPEVRVAHGHCLVLGRLADGDEMRDWAAALERGETTVAGMLSTLITSPEFATRLQEPEGEPREFVSLAYKKLLGREPDGHGLESYAGLIADGSISRRDVAHALASTGEFAARYPVFGQSGSSNASAPSPACDPIGSTDGSDGERLVAFVACLLLAPDPSSAGLNQWVTALDDGTASADDLLASALRSTLFEARHRIIEMSDRDYVRHVYNLLLGRDADGAGLDGYSAQLAAGSISRQDLAVALTHSSEFAARHGSRPATQEVTALVEIPSEGGDASPASNGCDLRAGILPDNEPERKVSYLHCLLLGRLPEEEALQNWARDFEEGRSDRNELSLALLASDEFAARHAPAEMSDADFVSLVFRLVLGRDPDGAGLEAYVSQLADRELSRENVTLGVIGSSEFAARYAGLAE